MSTAKPSPNPTKTKPIATGVIAAAVLTVVSALLLFSSMSAEFFPLMADETANAWAGKQVVEGRVPYTDFFVFRPPLAPYGWALLYEFVGPSIKSVRYLSIVWLTVTTLLFYVLIRRRGVESWLAAGVSLLLPALLVPVWPIPSHYWIALGFTAAGAVAVTWTRFPRLGAFLGGLAAGLSGGMVQTFGVLAGAIVLAVVIAQRPRRGARIALAIAGMVLPFVIFAVMLWMQGALRTAFELVVLWPMQHYRQPGGYNDLEWRHVLLGIAGSFNKVHVLEVFANGFLLSVAGFALLHVVARAGAVRDPAHRTRWLADALLCVITVVLFRMARTDFVHVAFWMPMFLYVATRGLLEPTPAGGRRVVKWWLIAGLVISLARWGVYWVNNPPSPGAVARSEDRFRTSVIDSLLSHIPGAVERRQPVLWLSEHGSRLYFYHAPAPPPLDMVMPLSAGYNPVEDHQLLAEFARDRRVPYVLIPNDMIQRFLTEESPLRDMLLHEYEQWLVVGKNTVFIRSDVQQGDLEDVRVGEPYVEHDVCEGDGCAFGRVCAVRPIPVYATEGDAGQIAFTIARGDTVETLEGNMHHRQVGGVLMLRDTTLVDQAGFRAAVARGDTIPLLSRLGEGRYYVWLDGARRNVASFWGRSSPWARLLREADGLWWVKVRERSGREGWAIIMTDMIQGPSCR